MPKSQPLISQAPLLSSVILMRHCRIHWFDIQMTLQCTPLRVSKPTYVNSPLFDPNAENYMIERSYTDLESFHKALCHEFPHERLPEFPKRNLRQVLCPSEDYFLMKQVNLYFYELFKYSSDYLRPSAIIATFLGTRHCDLKKEMAFSYLENWNLMLKIKKSIKKNRSDPPQRLVSTHRDTKRRQSLLALATTNEALKKQDRPKVHFEERWSIGGTTPIGTPRTSEEPMPASLTHLFPSNPPIQTPQSPPKVNDTYFQKVKVHIEESHTIVIKAKSSLSWLDLKHRINQKLIRNGIFDSNHPECYFSCFENNKESMTIIESEAQWQSIMNNQEEWIHLYLVH